MGTKELPKEYLNIGGASVTLIGDTVRAREYISDVQKMFFHMKSMNNAELPQTWLNKQLPGGGYAHVNTRFGTDTAYIYIPPRKEVPPGPRRRYIEEIQRRPVLGIPLSISGYGVPTVFIAVCDTTDPLTESKWHLLEPDEEKRIRYPGTGRTKTITKLEWIGQWDDFGGQHTDVDEYPQVPADWLLQHEFAYRSIWDPFGNNWVNVDPVIFTCGHYEAVTTVDTEFYLPIDRAERYDTRTSYRVFIDNDVIVASAENTSSREYEFTYDGVYNIPSDLINDGWPQDYIDRCCHAYGDYHLYTRSGLQGVVTDGDSVYYEAGEGVPTNGRYNKGEFSVVLYAWVSYTQGTGITYTYELRLVRVENGDVENGITWTILHGDRIGDGDLPDDVYVDDLRIFDFHGEPVAAFTFTQYFRSKTNYTRYGMLYKDKLYLTEEFPEAVEYTGWHTLKDITDEDGNTLYGKGYFHVYGIEEKIIREID
ncbi:MAG: hypothetical protein WDA47_01735 [Bacilli bacterium]